MVGSLSNVTVACGCMKGTCIPNFSLISQKLWRLSHVFTFGRLVGCASLQARILIKVTFSKQLTLRYFHVKYQGDSSRRFQDIPFLQFFQKISIGRKFGWSDLRDHFYMNVFLIECLPTKFHQVPIRK